MRLKELEEKSILQKKKIFMHVVLCDQIKTVNAKISEGEDNQRKGENLYLCVVFGPL